MSKTKQTADPNAAAFNVAEKLAEVAAKMPLKMEAAWAEWLSHLQGVDERTLSLLRAAFEMGYEDGYRSGLPAAALGRLGGLKGGKARAAKLTPEQRKAIAKKAAATRWSKRD